MAITSKERVRAAFHFEDVDRVPVFEQEIASNVASDILGKRVYTGGGGTGWRDNVELLFEGKRDFLIKRLCEDNLELYTVLDLDVFRVPLAPAVDAKGADRKLDENTYYSEDEETRNWSVRRYDPKTRTFMVADSSVRREGLPAIERLIGHMEKEPIEYDEGIFETLDYVVERAGEERFITGYGGIGVSPEVPWLKAMMEKPDLIGHYLDLQLGWTKELIRLQKRHGVDFILGGGDLADNHGPLYPPRLFRKLLQPRLKELTSYCHELGLPYIFRSDGNLWPIARELFLESSVDGYGEIDAQAGMNIAEIRKNFPNLVLWGNVDCAKTLPFGPEEKIIAETRKCLRDGSPGGGHILGSSNTIHPNVPARNFLTMLKTAKKYGSYPKANVIR